MRLYFCYTMVHKSQKWPKTQIKGGGPALRTPNVFEKNLFWKYVKNRIWQESAL